MSFSTWMLILLVAWIICKIIEVEKREKNDPTKW